MDNITEVKTPKSVEEKIKDIYEARKTMKLENQVVGRPNKRIPLDLIIDNVKPENFEVELDKVVNKQSTLSRSCRDTILEIANAIIY